MSHSPRLAPAKLSLLKQGNVFPATLATSKARGSVAGTQETQETCARVARPMLCAVLAAFLTVPVTTKWGQAEDSGADCAR